MLHQFSVAFLMFIGFLIIYGIIKVIIPLWRLLKKVDLLEKFFVVVNKIVSSESSLKKVRINISLGNNSIHFENKNDACKEIEKLVAQSLETYKQIEWLERYNPQIHEEKLKILNVLEKVTKLREKFNIKK